MACRFFLREYVRPLFPNFFIHSAIIKVISAPKINNFFIATAGGANLYGKDHIPPQKISLSINHAGAYPIFLITLTLNISL